MILNDQVVKDYLHFTGCRSRSKDQISQHNSIDFCLPAHTHSLSGPIQRQCRGGRVNSQERLLPRAVLCCAAPCPRCKLAIAYGIDLITAGKSLVSYPALVLSLGQAPIGKAARSPMGQAIQSADRHRLEE